MKKREYELMITTVFNAVDDSRTLSRKQKQLLKKRVAVNLLPVSPQMHKARAKRIAERRSEK